MAFEVPSREEIRKMKGPELDAFAKEVRSFLVDKISKKGGHLASNLGAVELTIAMWRAFDFPVDKAIFDVGHQAYTYKILSGRAGDFNTLREFGGLSGFPKRAESEYDSFDTGHSSTSISAGLGMCRARDLKGEDFHVVSVIGDGALTGGEAFEALNNTTSLKSNFIIILNDNEMSINRNVGGMAKALTDLRSSSRYNKLKNSVKSALQSTEAGQRMMRSIGNTKDSLKEIMLPSGMIFENLGIKYLGPVDGHNILQMERVMNRAKELERPVVIHVITKKGKGYEYAEKRPAIYHGVGAFDPSVGVQRNEDAKPTYKDVLSEFLLDRAVRYPELVTVTAAMGDNVGFQKFRRAYSNRCFDVGIAEQHAVTFSAGLAAGGLHPYLAVYSSFLQRGYDQLVHDVCMQKLNVTFLLDRAGLVGKDGETHQGAFDLSFMNAIPNMTILAPKDGDEFRAMLEYSLTFQGPLAIRYPRGACGEASAAVAPITYGSAALLASPKIDAERQVTILSVGNMAGEALKAKEILEENDIAVTIQNVRFVKPFDETMTEKAFRESDLVVTMEDGVKKGGFGETVAALFASKDSDFYRAKRVMNVGIPDTFVPHGTVDELYRFLKMDGESTARRIIAYFETV